MLYRNSYMTILLRFFGAVFVLVGLFSMLAVVSVCSLGIQYSPAWLYYFIWPHALEILSGSTLSTVFGAALSLYPAQKVPLQGQNYELGQG